MELDFSTAWTQLRELAQGILARLPYVALSTFIFILFLFVAKGIRNLVRRFAERRTTHRNLAMVLGRLARTGVVILGLLVALVIALPRFTPARLVEFLGITSIAVGFAFKDILQNFLAGLLILLTQPFRIGDQIIVGNFEGTVEDIQTRATFIRTYDGRRVVIPNAHLFTDSVLVNTAYEVRRLEHDVGIGYGDDLEKAKRLMLEAIRSAEGVLADPAPEVLVVDLAESTVNLRARWWITPPLRRDALETRARVLTAIKQRLTENGIDLPFPTRQVLFHDQTEETDGDRTRQREGWPAGTGPVPKPRPLSWRGGRQGGSEQEVTPDAPGGTVAGRG